MAFCHRPIYRFGDPACWKASRRAGVRQANLSTQRLMPRREPTLGPAPTPLPLADVHVIDLTVARAGPTCVRQLADWGADVVRVEPIHRSGIDAGRWQSSDMQNLHRSKRCVSVDLKSDEGREIVHRVAQTSDVVVEHTRTAV